MGCGSPPRLGVRGRGRLPFPTGGAACLAPTPADAQVRVGALTPLCFCPPLLLRPGLAQSPAGNLQQTHPGLASAPFLWCCVVTSIPPSQCPSRTAISAHCALTWGSCPLESCWPAVYPLPRDLPLVKVPQPGPRPLRPSTVQTGEGHGLPSGRAGTEATPGASRAAPSHPPGRAEGRPR